MIKCEDGSGVKSGSEFRLPISAASLPPDLVAPTRQTEPRTNLLRNNRIQDTSGKVYL